MDPLRKPMAKRLASLRESERGEPNLVEGLMSEVEFGFGYGFDLIGRMVLLAEREGEVVGEEDDGRMLGVVVRELVGLTEVPLDKGGGAKADTINLVGVIDRRNEAMKREGERLEGVMIEDDDVGRPYESRLL